MDKASVGPAADAIREESPERRPAFFLHRALVLAALVAFCMIAYGLMLTHFDLSKTPREVELGAASAKAGIWLYLEPIQVDPVNDSLQMRISVVPNPNATETAAAIADRDVLLKIRRGREIEQVRIKAGQPLPEVNFSFDLDGGDIRDYPLDSYTSDMTLAAIEPAGDGAERSLPVHATAWEGLLGYDVKVHAMAAAQHQDALPLQIAISRTGAISFFGLAIYGAMLFMAVCALVIGSLVFIGVRRIETTLVSALGAMIFALPALRNTLPGAPPLGVRGDILIFFWAEFGAIIALCLFVIVWVRHGPRP